MENENKYFLQIKNYILSVYQLLNILNSENTNDYKNDWDSNIFYAISRKTIEDWKLFIHFDEICKELNINKGIEAIDSGKEKIISHINKIPNLKESMDNNLAYEPLNNFPESNKNISNYDLISKNAWELFVKDKTFKNDAKILIKKGYKKIIIKSDKYNILYLKKDIYAEDIPPNKLNEYLNEIEIKIIKANDDINILINEIIKEDIYNWLKKINYYDDPYNCRYKYKNFELNIKSKKRIIFNTNFSSIYIKNESKITKYPNKKSIRDLNYINKIIVVKIKNTSYIIASMYSLSQIPEFSDYFYEGNYLFEYFSQELKEFKKYLNVLWKKNNNHERFQPISFMKSLKFIDDKIFDFKNEREPIEFLDIIFRHFNEQLNRKDKEIFDYFDKYKNLPNFKDFSNYYETFKMTNNSIFGKIFYGIFQIKYSCSTCGEKKYYEEFNHINLDNKEYSIFYSNNNDLDNSLVDFYIDDLIEFYFKNEDHLNNRIDKKDIYEPNRCEKCGKEKKIIEKKIIRFPDIIIFNIKWEDFNSENGFYSQGIALEQNKFIFDEIIDLTNYSYNNNIGEKIRYKVRSIINYSAVNNDNLDNHAWHKFITFNRNLINDKYYSCQPSGTIDEINRINRMRFVPSVLFYERIK